MKRVIAAMVAALLMVGLVAGATFAASGPKVSITATGTVTGVDDIGTCGQVWATDSLTKTLHLTRLTATTYNLEVKEDGPFTTIAGSSPGACESGANNGNTVAAGITGKDHQEFNQTVTTPLTPNLDPKCAHNACAGADAFLAAVFGTADLTRTAWVFTGHYTTGSNGTWFDTSVNWPRNDRGDITGS